MSTVGEFVSHVSVTESLVGDVAAKFEGLAGSKKVYFDYFSEQVLHLHDFRTFSISLCLNLFLAP